MITEQNAEFNRDTKDSRVGRLITCENNRLVVKDTKQGVESEAHQDISLGNWLMTFLTMDIPIIGYVVLLACAFGKNSPQVKKSMCKAYLVKKLIFTALSICICIILFYIGSYWLDGVLEYMQQL